MLRCHSVTITAACSSFDLVHPEKGAEQQHCHLCQTKLFEIFLFTLTE